MYCTPEDIRSENELLRDTETFPDGTILPYIERSQTRIETKLSKRYRVPLAEPVPEIVKTIAVEMACGFVLIGETASRSIQEIINLGNSKIKRADTDLEELIEKGLIDSIPGIVMATAPGSDNRPQIGSTTPNKSPIEGALDW
ncbi:hypothetical protein Sgly_0773 [Syntrophobotulus glycolicus DSM 8271]|uniref:Uncharacterized protein n=1 Tax=Syntrophobotulus glycolicus (strain DSM 8271 / FlGlyR) TaxID=645991 RepID=F0T166_SYNGF|nr:phage protein Gp36 family protein [Syntrophobotulus glycolicus]ADY55130.1 hypothetical protein Sgly_0773 [Syntrophobotulus glycolicus DSM 8271]